VILCGHVNLLPLAAMMKRLTHSRLWLTMHGVEVWSPPSGLRRRCIPSIDLATAVSRYSRHQFLTWAPVLPSSVRVLPNTIDLDRFSPGEKPEYLVSRYGIRDRTVLLMVGRLSESERQKGHDRIIGILPALVEAMPKLLFMIIGAGSDLSRLRGMVEAAGVEEHVVFTGKIPDEEIVDHYRLAKAFVMPSTQEGFGIAFLEAAACGVPVLGGRTDGSWDALAEGEIGIAIDPDNPSELMDGVCRALSQSQRVPPQVRRFSSAHFETLVHGLLTRRLLSCQN
jgi:glycosyltransferase involved in cell wall biosynthesis